jgi:hypothetical protein
LALLDTGLKSELSDAKADKPPPKFSLITKPMVEVADPLLLIPLTLLPL